MTLDDYNAATSLSAYYPSRTETRQARMWAVDKLIYDLAELGFIEFFEGAGSDPTVLSGYSADALWLRYYDADQTQTSTVRKYDGVGDVTLLASWPVASLDLHNVTLALSGDVSAIEALSTTGIAARTATDTWATRTITGTSGEITVANGDGVAGNPTLSISSAVTLTGKTLTGGTFSGPTITSPTITGLADPSSAQDAATKAYVDSVGQGLDIKDSCVAATTTNITLIGAQTIDGVSVSSQRVLVKNQTTASQNGIYTAHPVGAWSRATDMDAWDEVPGAFVFVTGGTTQANSGWTCTSAAGGTLDTTSITWTQFSAAGNYSAGTGLSLAGSTFSISDAELLAIAGLTSAADKVPYFTGSGTASLATVTSAARSVLDDTTIAAMATTLGLGTGDSPQFTAINLGHASDTTLARSGAGDMTIEGNVVYRAGGTDVAITDGGTGASTASGARTNLGLDYADEIIGTARNIGGAVGDGTTNDRTAMATANTAGDAVLPRGTYRISSNITLNKRWQFMPGAMLSIDAGVVVTFSKFPMAGREQIFTGAGALTGVQFVQAGETHPEWWGGAPGTASAQNTYIQAAHDSLYAGGIVRMGAGNYYLSHTATLEFTKTGVSLRGEGRGATVFIPTGAGTTALLTFSNQDAIHEGFTLNADNWYVTSSTSLAIGTGSKTFTTSAGYSFVAGDVIRAQSYADPANYMQGTVTSYSGTSLIVNMTSTGGSGTKADWRIGNVNIGIKTDYNSGLSTGFGRSWVRDVKITGMWRPVWLAYASGGGLESAYLATFRDTAVLFGAGGSGIFCSQCRFNELELVQGLGAGITFDYNTASVYGRKVEFAGGTYGTWFKQSYSGTIDGTNYKLPENIWLWNSNVDFAYLSTHRIDAGHLVQIETSTASGSQAGSGVLINDSENVDGLGNRYIDGVTFNNCEIFGNAQHGVEWLAGANVRLINCLIFGNSVSAADTYHGVYVEGASNPTVGSLEITGCYMSADAVWGNSTSNQLKAVYLASGAMTTSGSYVAQVNITNNVMLGYSGAPISDGIEGSTLAYSSGYKQIKANVGVGTQVEQLPTTFVYSALFSGGLSSSGAVAVASSSANALTVGLNGATNPQLQVDASTASAATGIKIVGAAVAAGAALSVISSGTNENLTIDAKGSGTIKIGGTSTGNVGIGGNVNSTYKLQVAQSVDAASGIRITNATSGASAVASLVVAGGTSNSSIFLNLADNSASPYAQLQVGSAVTALYIDSDTLIYRKSNTTELARMSSVGNFKIGGTASRGTTEGTNQLVLFNGTAPVGTLTNGASFYAASGEMRVMDSAGNSTLLSPHDPATNEWIFDSTETTTGRRLTIRVEAMLKALNDLHGWDYVKDNA